jgi:hypothetical protein
MTIPIKKFTIYGERSSGTNFLEKSILTNFEIKYTKEFGNKHFFCFDDSRKNYSDDTLFIGIVRNPIYWLNSFIQQPYHVPNHNKTLTNFLFNEFYSICDEPPTQNDTNVAHGNLLLNRKNNGNKINKKDLNYITGKKYKDIFELRKLKNYYLMNVLPKKVKNYVLINYEDLLYNYENTLDLIKHKFNLIQTREKYIKSDNYKHSDTIKYKGEKSVIFSPKIVEVIWTKLDKTQENSLGYFKGDYNKFFKDKNKTKN